MTGGGSQKNKAHKAGRRAGPSARDKHRDKKNLTSGPNGRSLRVVQARADRLHAAKQARDAKRDTVLHSRRFRSVAPVLVGVLPITPGTDLAPLWRGLSALARVEEGEGTSATPVSGAALEPLTLQRRERGRPVGRALRLLPPPRDLGDPLAVADLGRAADLLLLVVDPTEGRTSDEAEGALRVLRALGQPAAVAVALCPSDALKARAASKKVAAELLGAAGAGASKATALSAVGDSAGRAEDLEALLRALSDAPDAPPRWRQLRSALVPDEAWVKEGSGQGGPTLTLRGFVRVAGLDAHAAVHVPDVGDLLVRSLAVREGPGLPVDRLVRPEASRRAELARENVPDPTAGEQTWPTAEDEEGAAGGGRRRKIPRGTSEYQAAWILDDDDDEGDDDDDEGRRGEGSDSDADMDVPDAVPGTLPAHLVAGTDAPGSGLGARGLGGEDEDAGGLGSEGEGRPESAGDILSDGEGSMLGGEESDEDEGMDPEEALARKRRIESDELAFPDEVETPLETAARDRFARFRGLRSFRSTPWDAREGLPREYARIFAFDDYGRARKRAVERARAAGAPGEGECAGSPAGAYVDLELELGSSPEDLERATAFATRVARAARGLAAYPVATALLAHETRLSVLHFGVRKAASYEAPLRGKERLLLLVGPRTFRARPTYSTDDPRADKHKSERFLFAGRDTVATCYAPIAYGPMPVLAFKEGGDGSLPPVGDDGDEAGSDAGGVDLSASPQLSVAFTGTLRSADPDRVILKKAVLSGHPIRTHRGNAVVKHMFFQAGDVRWFRPVEIWTRSGRRGRIREPIGTHGLYKAVFDGPISQQDAVCMSLYKRQFPKWPPVDAAFRG